MRKFPIHGVFMIKCECGRRTGADTETAATRFWNELKRAGEKGECKE